MNLLPKRDRIMRSAEFESLGNIHYFGQSVLENSSCIQWKNHVLVEDKVSLLINAYVHKTLSWQTRPPFLQRFCRLPWRFWLWGLTTWLAMWGKLAPACPFVWALRPGCFGWAVAAVAVMWEGPVAKEKHNAPSGHTEGVCEGWDHACFSRREEESLSWSQICGLDSYPKSQRWLNKVVSVGCWTDFLS